MRILIADKLSSVVTNQLDQAGYRLKIDANLKDESLVQALSEEDPHILVVRSTKVPRAALAAAASLSLVIRAGAGVNTIDVEAASELGIYVANCPGKNAVAVAELTLGLILAIDRSIPDNVIELRSGHWDKKRFGVADGLKGKTLGLIGFGDIAKEVAKRALAFDMKVAAWSRSLTKEMAEAHEVIFTNSVEELNRIADIVSVHLALTPETKEFCNEKFFNSMKDKAYFINTSRGEVVQESALLNALNGKGLRCGLDVFCNEPTNAQTDWTSELATHKAVYGTHHIGASSTQAENEIGAEVVKIINTFSRSGSAINCVNIKERSSDEAILNIRHLNKVGVLAAILHEVRSAGINVLNMENLIFKGGAAATAMLTLSAEPSSQVLTAIKNNDAVISVISNQ